MISYNYNILIFGSYLLSISTNHRKRTLAEDMTHQNLPPPSVHQQTRNGIVRLKSLDYTFADDNTAILTPKLGGARQKQKVDAQVYCRQILASRGGMKKNGLSSSAGHLAIDTEQLLLKKDVTKSPGFRREKQMDKQRKKLLEEEDEKFVKKEEDDHKSSFWQC